MADKEQTTREAQPQKWVPPTREAVPTGPSAPFYPSCSSAARPPQPDLDAAIRLDPEHAAAQLVEALREDGAEEQLTHFFSALRQRLEGDAAPAPEEGPLHERLQALEATVEELAEKLASAPRETREPATPHEAALARVRQLVEERAESVARQVRTTLAAADVADAAADELPPLQKTAILFAALGEELTGEVMKHFSDHEIEEVSSAVARLEGTSVEVQTRVLEEFEKDLLAGNWYVIGGPDFARATLERTVGPRRAHEILERVTTHVSSGFYILKNVSPEQLVPFIAQEHPQTVALILSQLEPAQAAGILGGLPVRMQPDVAYRIAIMENVTPSVIREIDECLEANLQELLGGNQDVGGPKVVADILNLTGPSVEKNVLDQMDAQDPEVVESVRNLMFTFEDIAKLTDRELQTLLREVDQKDLVISLKGAREELIDKILRNMSEETRTLITEEMEYLGPMRLSEVEEVQLRIVQQVRQLEKQGQITIVKGDAEDTFV